MPAFFMCQLKMHKILYFSLKIVYFMQKYTKNALDYA